MNIQQRRLLFIAAIAVQLLILIAIAIPRMITLNHGRTVTFETEPIDPWDLFRGDYVQMRYPFSKIPTKKDFKPSTPVFVLLQQDTPDKWRAKEILTEKPPTLGGDLLLRARINYSSGSEAHVTYGLEQVFVAEGTGKDLGAKDRLNVDVVVDDDGNAVITELRHKDRKLFQWKWF
ncbi:MAG: GDYXXLXY domain-containing protein [Candidatus Melainabacteria bacterium]|nr:GDYXXLXY domain-containing protein [Candidatus Melainabacteria bacterium]